MSKGKLAGIVIASVIVIAVVIVVVIPRLTPSREPAEFRVSNLLVSPDEVEPEEPVTVTAQVQNVGEEEGTYELELIIDGLVEQSRNVTLDGAEQTTVVFAVQRDTKKFYSMEVDGLSGSFEVVAPAEFEVSNLSVSPKKAEPGETITVTVDLRNTGGASGDYVVEMKIDGAVEDAKTITIDGGETTTVSFTVQKQTKKSYSVEIGGLTGTFEVVAPAEFEVSHLTVNPEEVEPGETVTITVKVQNVGAVTGTHELTLEIDGIVEETQDVILDGGESSTVSFTATKDVEKTYGVTIDGLSTSFKVRKAPIDWSQIGVPYQADDGLTVTLLSFDVVEKTGSYQYNITYTLVNETDSAIDEGQFKLYYEDEPGGYPQYGFFDRLFPGDELTRSHTFEEEKHITFGVLAYHSDQFFASSPPANALQWRVEY